MHSTVNNGINITVKIPIDNPMYLGFEKTDFSYLSLELPCCAEETITLKSHTLSKVAIVPSGLVTVTSQQRSRGGPPSLVMIVAVIVVLSTTTVFETFKGPLPPVSETCTPTLTVSKPVPVIVTLTEPPDSTVFGSIKVIEIPCETALTVIDIVAGSLSAMPSFALKIMLSLPVKSEFGV